MIGELIFCSAIFALQVALHVATFLPGSELTVMHGIGAFVVGIISSAVFARLVPNSPLFARNLSRDWLAQAIAQKAMLIALPAWFRRAAIVAGIYFASAFAVAVFAQRHGSPEIRDGDYWAGNRKLGIAYRRIDRAEYWRLEAHLVRLMTGLGALVSWMPIAVIVRHRDRLKRGGTAGDHS